MSKPYSISKQEPMNIYSNWSKFFIDKYRITLILIIAFVGLGVYGMIQNQKQDFPAIPANFIVISSVYPGASPDMIAYKVLQPLQNELKGHDQVIKTRSSASANFGYIVVETKDFNVDTINKTVSDFQGIVDTLTLPREVTTNIFVQDIVGPTMVYALTSESESLDKIIQVAPLVKDYLENTSLDIKKIELTPKSNFEVLIKLDRDKLNKQRLSYTMVKNAINNNLIILPGGSIKDSQTNQNKQISISQPATNLQDIKDIIVQGNVKLADIATISRVPADTDSLSMAGYIENGQAKYSTKAVYLTVYKTNKGDVIKIKEALQTALDKIYDKGIIDKKMSLHLVFDSAAYVQTQINSLVSNGILGLIIILVVFMFLIDLRTGLIVSMIIPLAFFITLFVLKQIGFTINTLTLFAMILTLGILVDNAIVIAEGIVHRMHKYGENSYKAAILAVRDLGAAVTVATVTTMVVFVPFANIGGLIGEFMKYIPYTIILMLAISYFLAITITPLLSWILLKRSSVKKDASHSSLKFWQKALVIPAMIYYGQLFFDNLVKGYGVMMGYVYKSLLIKGIILVAVILGLVGSLSLFISGAVPGSQFPVVDSPQLAINIQFPTGTNQKVTKEITEKILAESIKIPYFQGAFAFQNSLQIIITEPTNRADDKVTTVFTIAKNLNLALQPIREQAPAGTNIKVNAQSNGPPASSYDLVIDVKSNDTIAVKNLIADIDAFVQNQSADYPTSQIDNSLQSGLVSSLDVVFNKNAIQTYQVQPLITSAIINSTFSEAEIGSITLRDDGVTDKVKLLFDDKSTNSINKLESLLIPTGYGKMLPLKEIADIKAVIKPSTINFVDGVKTVTYQLQIDVEEDKRTIKAKELENKLKDYLTKEKLQTFNLELDNIKFGGFSADLQSDFENLFVVLIIAMIAVYLVLVLQFNSYVQPALIMFAIPVSLIGVFPSVYLSGSSIDMISGLGILALVGIVVNDAIVFIDYYNRQRRTHPEWSINKTLRYTGEVRFKPIFSTSVTTIAGILPLTLQDPFWRGLGSALIGGLILATLGNLIVLPILIGFTERLMRWLKSKGRGLLRLS